MRTANVVGLLALFVLACGSAKGTGNADDGDSGMGSGADSSTGKDGTTGATQDGSVSPEGGSTTDGGGETDSGTVSDAGQAGDSGTANDAGKTTDAGSVDRSAGCGTSPPHTANYTASTTDGSGNNRSYAVYLPSAYDNETPLALTIAYHGAGGDPSQSEGWGIQNAPGASASSIFLFPKGIDYKQNGTDYGVGWDDLCSGYDMVFFDHMLSDIETHYCVDTARIFVAGFSWGCDQVTALTCCRGDKIRATSAASCTDEYAKADDYTTYDNLKCPNLSKTAVRFTHDADGGDIAYPAPLFFTTSKLYQSFNGCPSSTGTLTPDVCHTYSGCSNEFIECPYTHLGHAIPAGWATDTWTFFDSFK